MSGVGHLAVTRLCAVKASRYLSEFPNGSASVLSNLSQAPRNEATGPKGLGKHLKTVEMPQVPSLSSPIAQLSGEAGLLGRGRAASAGLE